MKTYKTERHKHIQKQRKRKRNVNIISKRSERYLKTKISIQKEEKIELARKWPNSDFNYKHLGQKDLLNIKDEMAIKCKLRSEYGPLAKNQILLESLGRSISESMFRRGFSPV